MVAVDFDLLVDAKTDQKDCHVREDLHVARVEPLVSVLLVGLVCKVVGELLPLVSVNPVEAVEDRDYPR